MPNIPIQTGKKQFRDSYGNTQDVSRATALGPLASGPVPADDVSRCGPRFQPIRFHHEDNRPLDWREVKEKPQNGYGNPVDDPAFLKLWGHP